MTDLNELSEEEAVALICRMRKEIAGFDADVLHLLLEGRRVEALSLLDYTTECTTVCKRCEKIIYSPLNAKGGRPRLFCSDECRRAYWKDNPECSHRKPSAYYRRVCPNCRMVFLAYGKINRKYCSHNCYVQHRFNGANHEK